MAPTEQADRDLALQYLALAFCRLGAREQAVDYLRRMFAYLATDPERLVIDGRTGRAVACEYLSGMTSDAQNDELHLGWLRGDPQIIALVKRYTNLFGA